LSTDGLLARVGRVLAGSWAYRRPPHAFVLTEERLVHVVAPREARAGGGLVVRSRELPPGTFQDAPSGGRVAGPALAQAVAALLPPNGRLTAASLAVPDGFVKAAPVDVEPGVEKNAKELAEVLRWKVGRLWGEPAPALRIGWCRAGDAAGGGPRFLVVSSPEETVSSCEAAFAARGIRIGALEPASLALSALAARALRGSGFVVFADGTTVSTVWLEGGAPRFLRTRAATADTEDALQEFRLAATFVGGAELDGLGPDLSADVIVVPEATDLASRLRELRRENGGKEPVSLLEFLAGRGFPVRAGDTAPLVGLGLLEGAE
jgi:hypothetical protein